MCAVDDTEIQQERMLKMKDYVTKVNVELSLQKALSLEGVQMPKDKLGCFMADAYRFINDSIKTNNFDEEKSLMLVYEHLLPDDVYQQIVSSGMKAELALWSLVKAPVIHEMLNNDENSIEDALLAVLNKVYNIKYSGNDVLGDYMYIMTLNVMCYNNPAVKSKAVVEVWSNIAMYALANNVFHIVNRYGKGPDDEEGLDVCLATLVQCARGYNPTDGSKLGTYAYRSMINEIRRKNREENHIKFPDKVVSSAAYISSHMEDDDADISKHLRISQKRVKIIKEAIMCQSLTSLDDKVGDDENTSIGDLIADKDNVVDQFCENETAETIMTKFTPIIAEIYGEDFAYVTLIRTGLMNGYEAVSFYKMEELYCNYLCTKKKLNALRDSVPEYADICDKVRRTYAMYGPAAAHRMIVGLPEEYLIKNILNEAHAEATQICNDKKRASDCFKPAGSLNYMFSKVFPTKPSSFNDADRRLSARFRRELRDIGLDRIADAVFAKMNAFD